MGVDYVRHCRLIEGSFHVERETGDQAILILSLNQSCSIVSVCDGRRRVASPRAGAVSMLPPGCRYATTIEGTASALFFELPWRQVAGWMAAEGEFSPERVQLEARMCVRDDVLARSLLGMAAPAPGVREEALQVALDRIVRSHSNEAGTAPDARRSGGLTPRQLRRVTDAVEDRLASDLTLDDLVGEAGLSKFHFIRAFKATVGTTPHQYVLDRRLERALEALLDGRVDVEAVAKMTGFSHASHLSRMMKRRFGTTPDGYRRAVLPQATYGPRATSGAGGRPSAAAAAPGSA